MIDRSAHRWLFPALAVAAGVVVANLYYNQPLLAAMTTSLHVSQRAVGAIPAVTQLGYGVGMLTLVPLGDRFERRALIVRATFASAVVALTVAFATSFNSLLVASFALGLASMVPQYIVPYAAGAAPEGRRGQAVGTVMMGLLAGILLSRTVSGAVGARFGWRVMYVAAAVLCGALAIALRFVLPPQRPEARMTLRELYVSMLSLVRAEPLLRHTAILGACTFGAFSVFWSTLAFHLATPPHPYGSAVVGAFGVIGVGGALAAPVVGRFADRHDPRIVNGAAIATVIAAFAVFAAAGKSLVGIALGVVLLDLGAQSNHISNQTRIFSLGAALRNRLNTVYMFSYFAGGALGSWLGAWAWSRGGWGGVSLAGASLGGIAIVEFARAGLASRRAAA